MSRVGSVTIRRRLPNGSGPVTPQKSSRRSRGMRLPTSMNGTANPPTRWMRLKAARGLTRTSRRGPKPIRWLYDLLTGHGYYPLRAAGWLILAIIASGLIVYFNAADFTPTAANKAAWKTPAPAGEPAPPITGATPCAELQDRASCLNPILYAFDNALPGTLATGQAAQWTANGAQGTNAWIPYVLGGLKIASWIFVALLLAGVTGLLRKT